MAVVLTVDRLRWHQHIAGLISDFGSQVTAVVKGNGYGFGRQVLIGVAEQHGVSACAVGTVHELAGTAAHSGDILCLTPTFSDVSGLAANVVLTVASDSHLDHLRRQGTHPMVAVKLRSSMQRYGFAPDRLPAASMLGGSELHCYMIHLPLSGTMAEHLAEIESWLDHLDPAIEISVSHLDAATFAALSNRHPRHSFTIRLGTALWLGDKSTMHLRADVLDTHPVRAGEQLGYRATTVGADGTVVLIGGGSAHGIARLEGGAGPFHFARTRLALIESPHMHTSMAFVPAGQPVPQPGEWVDVQRPLTMTEVDRIEWLD